MRKYLLPPVQGYKMSAHTHTSRSDGKLSPEEVKAAYVKKGYSIVAFTDHDVLIPENELTDEKFIAITAMELEISDDIQPEKKMHLNLYSKDPKKALTRCFNPNSLVEDFPVNIRLRGEMSEAQKAIAGECYVPKHTTEDVNRVIQLAREEGFLVSYNHPAWSCHTREDYIGLKGLWGVEWFNTAAVQEGLADSFWPIKDLLLQGENVFPLATDDMHGAQSLGRGFLLVKTAELTYNSVMEALEKGDFFSSNGPEITDLYIEDGKIHIETDRPCYISLNSGGRFHKCSKELLTEKDYDVSKVLENPGKTGGFLRVSVIDEYCRCAYTRAFRMEELNA